ncbi:DNA glycosylase [Rhodofomes roseus]|uniref:Endonuclease III homolog n=1 Tax=Rhodofomes roseus TaxID=34475 RepID=A0ABQ8KTR2_9APHY|nr:DNA glycosylase [Rhodofomes roseus]KAH9842465.1 DNA glycosylase [Rhodofomes roseus]
MSMLRPRKRSPPPETSLTSRTSSYHSAVTLFELPTSHETPKGTEALCSSRRSKRLRTEAPSVVGDDSVEDAAATKQESNEAGAGAILSSSSGPSKSRRTARDASSPRKRSRAIPRDLGLITSPARWREVYVKIQEMRSGVVAPVDTMGAGAAQLGETIPKNQRFATLVSLMLSSQTKDEVTSAAVRKLREAVGGSLSVDAVLATNDDAVSEAICKVGFWRRKTDYIKRTARRLQDEYDGDIPKTVDELCSLPGVGPKVAIIALHVGWKINAGVGVDVHVHRVTNRLGWHDRPTKTPEETRSNLEGWLPEDLRPTFTKLFVGFGQTICLPVRPRCESCGLNDGLCPTGSTAMSRLEGSGAAMKGESSPGPLLNVEVQEEVDVR